MEIKIPNAKEMLLKTEVMQEANRKINEESIRPVFLQLLSAELADENSIKWGYCTIDLTPNPVEMQYLIDEGFEVIDVSGYSPSFKITWIKN